MLPLPPVAPQVGHRSRIRLGRDYFVRITGSDYSVHPIIIGRMVEASADLDRVTITGEGRPVGAHRRSWLSAATVIDPAHVEAAARLRAAFQQPKPGEDPLRRDLAEYGRALGIVLDDGRVA